MSLRLVTIGGVTRSSREWAKAAGIAPATFSERLRRGVRGRALLQSPWSGHAGAQRKRFAARSARVIRRRNGTFLGTRRK